MWSFLLCGRSRSNKKSNSIEGLKKLENALQPFYSKSMRDNEIEYYCRWYQSILGLDEKLSQEEVKIFRVKLKKFKHKFEDWEFMKPTPNMNQVSNPPDHSQREPQQNAKLSPIRVETLKRSSSSEGLDANLPFASKDQMASNRNSTNPTSTTNSCASKNSLSDHVNPLTLASVKDSSDHANLSFANTDNMDSNRNRTTYRESKTMSSSNSEKSKPRFSPKNEKNNKTSTFPKERVHYTPDSSSSSNRSERMSSPEEEKHAASENNRGIENTHTWLDNFLGKIESMNCSGVSSQILQNYEDELNRIGKSIKMKGATDPNGCETLYQRYQLCSSRFEDFRNKVETLRQSPGMPTSTRISVSSTPYKKSTPARNNRQNVSQNTNSKPIVEKSRIDPNIKKVSQSQQPRESASSHETGLSIRRNEPRPKSPRVDEDPQEEDEQPLEIIDMHQYFADDFDINSVTALPLEERIEAIHNYAKTFEQKVNSFEGTNYSIAFFVLDEKLMRLVENLDKIKSTEDNEVTRQKVEAIRYIKDLQSILDKRAK